MRLLRHDCHLMLTNLFVAVLFAVATARIKQSNSCQYEYPAKQSEASVIHNLHVPVTVSLTSCLFYAYNSIAKNVSGVGKPLSKGLFYIGDGSGYEPLLLTRELLFAPTAMNNYSRHPVNGVDTLDVNIFMIESFNRGAYDVLGSYPSTVLEIISSCDTSNGNHTITPDLFSRHIGMMIFKNDIFLRYETSPVSSLLFVSESKTKSELGSKRSVLYSSKVVPVLVPGTTTNVHNIAGINSIHDNALIMSAVAVHAACPNVLVFDGYDRLPRYNLLADLAVAVPVLIHCQPALLVHNQDDDIAEEVLALLLRFYGAAAVHWVLTLSSGSSNSSGSSSGSVILDAHLVVGQSPDSLLSVSSSMFASAVTGESAFRLDEVGDLLWMQFVPYEHGRSLASDYGFRLSSVQVGEIPHLLVVRTNDSSVGVDAESVLLTTSVREYTVSKAGVRAAAVIEDCVGSVNDDINGIDNNGINSVNCESCEEDDVLRALMGEDSIDLDIEEDNQETPYSNFMSSSKHAALVDLEGAEGYAPLSAGGSMGNSEYDNGNGNGGVLNAIFSLDLLEIVRTSTPSEPSYAFNGSSVGIFDSLSFKLCEETTVDSRDIENSCVRCNLPLGRTAAEIPPFSATLPLYHSVSWGRERTPRAYTNVQYGDAVDDIGGGVDRSVSSNMTVRRQERALLRLRHERGLKIAALCRAYIASVIVSPVIEVSVWFGVDSRQPRYCITELVSACTLFINEQVKYREIMFQDTRKTETASTAEIGPNSQTAITNRKLRRLVHTYGTGTIKGEHYAPVISYDPNSSIVPTSGPLGLQYDLTGCLEPIYCSHMVEYLRRVLLWQKLPNSPIIEELSRNISFQLYGFDIGSNEAFAAQNGHHGGELMLPLASFDGEFPYQEPWRHHDEYYNCTHDVRNAALRYKQPPTATESSPADASPPTAADIEDRCASTRLLVYEIEGMRMGIGSMVTTLGAMMRFAMCHNRTLVISPQDEDPFVSRWKFPGCTTTTFECYFQPISSCLPSVKEIYDAPSVFRGQDLDKEPNAAARIVKMTGLPLLGHCSLCNDAWGDHTSTNRGLGPYTKNADVRYKPYSYNMDWAGDARFFDGFPTGEKVAMNFDVDLWESKPLLGVLSRTSRRWYSYFHFGAFRGVTKLPWMSSTVRFLLRPKAWFSQLLQYLVASTLRCGNEPAIPVSVRNHNASGETSSEGPSSVFFGQIPHPYVSMHIRHGIKITEQKLVEVDHYFATMRKKYPRTHRVFLSTESAWTINYAIENYPELEIYHLAYHRVRTMRVSVMEDLDYPYEFVFSLANLYLAVEADGFVGTLTSNWCAIIQYLQHTRGDGGMQYHSLDQRGSAYSQCF